MPRRSTGCRNCVRRKILCDKMHPRCQNCRTRKIKCDGSHVCLQFIFVAANPSAAALDLSSWTDKIAEEEYSILGQAKSNIPTSLEWSHRHSDTRLCYLMTKMVDEDRVWLNYCARRPEKCAIASLAIDALATMVYERRHPSYLTSQKAAVQYTQALAGLRDGLRRIDVDRFDVLAAATAMNRYEVLTCTSGRAWMQHAGGISKIVQLAGPNLFQQYPYSMILDCNRLYIIHEAYHWRKPTFLRQGPWRVSRHVRSRTELHLLNLYDLYADLAEVASSVTGLTEFDICTDVHFQHALALVMKLISDLAKWIDEWISLLGLHRFKSPNDPGDTFYSDSQGLVFAESYDYPDARAATGMNMGIAFKLAALRWKHKLENPQWSPGTVNENVTEISEAWCLARDICSSLHLYFPRDPPQQILDPVYLMFTSIAAVRVFHKNSRELHWLEGIFEKVTDLTGSTLAKTWTKNYMASLSA